jgi:hypothetical protein
MCIKQNNFFYSSGKPLWKPRCKFGAWDLTTIGHKTIPEYDFNQIQKHLKSRCMFLHNKNFPSMINEFYNKQAHINST